jgi:hypothetical protein
MATGSASLRFSLSAEMTSMSSLSNSKNESRFSCARAGLPDLGMTAIPRWVAQRRRTWAVVLLYFLAMEAMVACSRSEGVAKASSWFSSSQLAGPNEESVVGEALSTSEKREREDLSTRREKHTGSDSNAEGPGELDELGLGEIRVELDLEYSGLDRSVAMKVDEESSREVGDSNRFGETGRVDVLHPLPGQVKGVIRRRHDSVTVVPFGRVWSARSRVSEQSTSREPKRGLTANGGIDVYRREDGSIGLGGGKDEMKHTLERDGKVNEVQIEVVDAPVCERPLRGGHNVLVGVEGVLVRARRMSTTFGSSAKSQGLTQSLLVIKTSSRLTMPSSIARFKPFPASISLP